MKRPWPTLGSALSLLLLMVLLVGCATSRDMRMLEAQLDELRSQQQALVRNVARLDSAATEGGVETRQLVVDLKQSVSEFSLRLDQVDAQLADLDQRLAGGATPAVAPVLIPAGEGIRPQGADAGSATSEAARDVYQQAFDALKQDDYAAAVVGFRMYVEQSPEGAEAASAVYWMGESFYGLGEVDSALVRFQAVLDQYPESGKVPAALFKIGNIYSDRGDKTKAYPYYRRLKEEFPQSLEYQQLRRTLEE